MNRYLIKLVFLIVVIFSGCSKNPKTRIIVNFLSHQSDTVKIFFVPFGEQKPNKTKDVVLKNGQLKVDTLIDNPLRVYLFPKTTFRKLSNGEPFLIPSNRIEIFVFPKNEVVVNAKTTDFYTDYTASGNSLNLEQNKYRKFTQDAYADWCKKFYNTEDNYVKGTKQATIRKLERESRVARKLYREKHVEFIKNNPDMELSAFLLSKERKPIIKRYYPLFSSRVKQSYWGEKLSKQIETWKKLSLNSVAPDFEYITYRKKRFRLKENRGKYVVIDFWGTWCGACILDIPKMKKFYNTNKDKVNLIGIAVRDSNENWTKAIQKYQMNWIQILNDKNTDDLIKKYGVEGFPTKIIINPEGKIEGVFLGSNDDFFVKINQLLNQ